MAKLVEIPNFGVVEFPDSMDDSAIDAAIRKDILKEKKKTGFFEDIGIGIESAGHSTKDALDLIAGGVAGHLGIIEDTELPIIGKVKGRDSIFDEMVARNKARDAELAGLDQGLGGKITSGVAQAVPMLAGGALLGGVKTAVAAPSIINALSQSERNVQDGASSTQAIIQAPVEGAIDYATMMMPVGKGIIGGAKWGAAGNVVGQAGVDLAGNIIQNEDVAKKNYNMDLTNPEVREKYLVSGAVGGIMGGAMGPLGPQEPRALSPEAEAAKAMAGGDQRKVDDTGRINPDEAQVGGETVDRFKAQITRITTELIPAAERKIEQLTDQIAKAESFPYKTKEEAENARNIIARKFEQIKEEQANIDAYKAEVKTVEDKLAQRGELPLTRDDLADMEHRASMEDAQKAEWQLDPIDPALRGQDVPPKNRDAADYQQEIDPVVDTIWRQAIDRGDNPLFAVIRDIADDTSNRYTKLNKTLAKAIIDNPVLRPIFQKISSDFLDSDIKSTGEYYPGQNLVRLSQQGMNATSVLHEVIHAGTYAVLDAVRLGITKNLTPTQIAAAKKLHELFETAKGRGLLSDDTRIKDVPEFVAYALSEKAFIAKLKGTNFFVRLWRTVLDLLGIQKDIQSAVVKEALQLIKEDQGKSTKQLDPDLHRAIVVEHFGEAAVKAAEEEALKAPVMNERRPPPVEVGGVHMAGDDYPRIARASMIEGVTEATLVGKDLPANHFSKNFFGIQQYVEQLKNHPLTNYVYSSIQDGFSVKANLLRNWMAGTSIGEPRTKDGHAVTFLEHVMSGKAPLLLLKFASDADVSAVQKVFIDNFNKGINHKDNLTGFTPKQKVLAEALANHLDRMRKDVNDDRKARGMPMLPYRKGWIPSVRTGDFFGFVTDKFGDIVHMERFKSQYEAKLWAKKVGDEFKIDILDGKGSMTGVEGSMIEMIQREMAERLGMEDAQDTMKLGQSVYATKTHHDMYRSGISGYLGSRWGLSEAGNVQDFRDAMMKGTEEFANAHQRAVINNATGEVMRRLQNEVKDPRQADNFQNAYDNATTLLDSALNRHGEDAAKWERRVRNFVDTVIAKSINGLSEVRGKTADWYPKVGILDRTLGISSQLFYISALTVRPGFWAAQLLASPQAFRQVFKEAGPLEASTSIGKGLMTAMFGGDNNFKDAVWKIANSRDTFHPQFINEINTLPGIGRAGSRKLKTFMEWGTGQKPAAKADSLSRYLTFAVMYQHYKGQGLRGDALAQRAADATETTMVMYNNPYKAPVFQKAGLIGQGIAPLTTFPMAQWGLLMADLKNAAPRKFGGTGKVSPLVVTALTSMMMGGAISLPLLVEWEILSSMAGDDEDGERRIPSLRRKFLELENNNTKVLGMDAKTAMLGGITKMADASAKAVGLSEGFDIGQGVRWNQIISKSLTGEADAIDLFPAISFATQVASAMKIIADSMTTDTVTETEKLRAMQKLSVLVGQKAVIEFMQGYNDRKMNASGITGRAAKETSDADVIASAVGSMSISSRLENERMKFPMAERRQAKEAAQRFGTLAAEAGMRGDVEKVQKAVMRILREDPKANVASIIKKIIVDKNIPQAYKDILAKNPEVIMERLTVGLGK